MKAFIIYTPHPKSIEQATAAMQSFEKFDGWEPELFQGLTPGTLIEFEQEIIISVKPLSRAADYYQEDPDGRYVFKKSCSLNHYRLFIKCVKLNEPIAVIEHDSHCVGNWKSTAFEDVLVLNINSALLQPVLFPIRHKNQTTISKGINDISVAGLHYRHDPLWNGAHIMPGTAAYAITPSGAQKMIDVYERVGWEQSDFIINTHNVRIQTIVPELFTFKLPNLSMSHGENLL